MSLALDCQHLQQKKETRVNMFKPLSCDFRAARMHHLYLLLSFGVYKKGGSLQFLNFFKLIMPLLHGIPVIVAPVSGLNLEHASRFLDTYKNKHLFCDSDIWASASIPNKNAPRTEREEFFVFCFLKMKLICV